MLLRTWLCCVLSVYALCLGAQVKKDSIKRGDADGKGWPFVNEMDTVKVRSLSAVSRVKDQPFAVDVLDTRELRYRNADVNRLLDAMPGIRVRETGGMGSSYSYSIHGLSGKSVRFFIDGIPMESFGMGFSISNLSVNMIERIEVYKGVVPVSLGADALGGAINIVTRQDVRQYLNATYSYGSYGTHRAALAGKMQLTRSGCTLQANAAYNRSDNNYQVWGNTVEVADEFGRPVASRKYRRFNDDVSTVAGRVEVGFENKHWADQLFLSLDFSRFRKGVQAGRTMAFVYGDVRYNEDFLMPSLRFSKKGLFHNRLNLSVFAAINNLEGVTVDTGTNKYNWEGRVINSNVTGELNGIYAQKSLFTFKDQTHLAVVNGTVHLAPGHTLALNTTYHRTRREGSDGIGAAEWTVPFREPQYLRKLFTGLSYEVLLLEGKWNNSFFVKNFSYAAEANVYDYNGAQHKELFAVRSRSTNWGVGYGTKWKTGNNSWIKGSIENACRLPDAVELLGNGNTILNAPGLQPERSLNLNASFLRLFDKDQYTIGIETNLFFRNTQNMIWLGESGLRGSARYENIEKLRSMGAEMSVSYTNKKWLEIKGNATYQDIRNRMRYTSSGASNIVFNDKMKNMPSLMANAEIKWNLNDLSSTGALLSVYLNTHYVESFFLEWPSLGNRDTKRTIPEQFVQDAGVTYVFSKKSCNISLECRNILDKQVFDNYLLQKPGRFLSIQLRYFLSQRYK